MTLKTAFLALALACAGLASAQPRTLYDSRIPTPEPRVTESERSWMKFLGGLAMQARLWDEKDFKPSEECAGEDFQINGVAPGAFTVQGAKQTAYLYTYCYFRPGWKQGLVIVQGKEVVAHYVFTALAHSMYALKDINRNGFTELVMEGSFTGQGYTESYLEIAELRPQRRLLGVLNPELASPYEDNCGTVQNPLFWKSRVIQVTPGKTPQFTQQVIQGKCGNNRVATSVGTIQPLKLTALPTGWIAAPMRY